MTALYRKNERLTKLRAKQEKYIKEKQIEMMNDKEEKRKEAAKLAKSESKHGKLETYDELYDTHEQEDIL